jgi:uncharacterized protein
MVLVGSLVAGCAPAPPRNEVEAANEFVSLLVRGKTGAAAERFDDKLKAVLPEQKLRQVWDILVARSGRFKQVVRTRTEDQAGRKLVYVTVELEGALVDVKLSFNADKRISGVFFAPLDQAKGPAGPPPYVRPDSFREEEVTVGQGKWALPGTLSRPAGVGPFPALILVHGSGPCDRDETVGPNKPFRDLAGGLASKGIAVLRYEKRTRARPAEFSALGSAFTVKEEIIDDALEAAALLRRTEGIDARRIFLLGHSLGGMVVPRIARLDTNITGFVIMATATPRSLEDRMLGQTVYLQGLPENVAPDAQQQFVATRKALAELKAFNGGSTNATAMVLGAPPCYWLDLRGYVPAEAAKDLSCPLLVLHAGRDYQVPMQDYDLWREVLGARTNVSFRLYPALNHLLIAGEGQSTPAEYARPGYVAGEVIDDIAQWILQTAPSAR